jgi:hypothetical protein
MVDRRAYLKLGLGGLALWLTACGDDEPAVCRPSDEGPALAPGNQPQHVEEIAAWLLSVEEQNLVAELRARLAAEWELDAVFAALLLVGARSIDSKYGGGSFHYVLVVAALRHFSRRAPADQLLVPLVYGILRTRNTIASQPWKLPDVDLSELPPAESADRRLLAAAETGAVNEAMRDVVALARSGDTARVRDTLLELGSRRAFQLGHEPICAAKVVPLLSELPGDWTEDVYRAVAFMLTSLDKAPADLVDHADVWRRNRTRVIEVPCSWLEGADDPAAVAGIANQLNRLADPFAALAVVEQRLDARVSARTIWDGIILAAGDRAYTSGDVHALTAVEALRDAYLVASSARVRLLLLLQGAAHGALARTPPKVAFSKSTPGPATLDEVFETTGARSAERALGYLQAGGDADAYVARVMLTNDMSTVDEHSYKSAHAALTEAERVPREWQNHLLALCRLLAPTAASPPNRAWELAAAPR